MYIDNRYKTPDSKSTSDFKINLPETLSFESNTCFYIDDFTCGHSWTSIEEFNNKLYLYLSEDIIRIANNTVASLPISSTMPAAEAPNTPRKGVNSKSIKERNIESAPPNTNN